MRPIFCGNFEFGAHQSDLERLFRRYGKVDRVEMKSGFAFVYMDDERDAEDAIRGLDGKEFGRKGRRLRVEWTKHERGGRKPVGSQRSANLRPSKTLFVINFPYHTRTRDLEHHFEPYGKLVNVRIRRNFAFVQYEYQEDATKALDATNMSKLLDRVISVEYAVREDDGDRRNRNSPDGGRGRDRSPDWKRSPSPYARERGSPDYGRGSSPPLYRQERCSPNYGHCPDLNPRRREQGSPDYDRSRSRTPRRGKASPDYGQALSLSPHRGRTTPDNGRASIPIPHRERTHLDNGVAKSSSPLRGRISPSHPQAKDLSPRGRVNLDYGRGGSSSPNYHEHSMSPQPEEKVVNGNGTHNRSASPYPREEFSSDYGCKPCPTDKLVPGERSPIDDYVSPVNDRRKSPSPARERPRS